MSDFDIILDSSQQNLREIPPKILQMHALKMLYLQRNFIKELPKNFFQKLPQLIWLDLRNNHLSTIPKGISHHQHLENLLISDNKIEALPNELGTLPKLKVLQIANNPLVYPNSKVIDEGTRAICAYLYHQYEKTVYPPIEYEHTKDILPQEEKEMKLEKEIRVMADYCNDVFPMQESIESGLVVRGLSKVKKDDSGIIHKITSTSPDKILLRSYFDDDKSTQTTDSISYLAVQPLKQTWMEKLKHLLEEQEKILQQERNLQTLTSWRIEKKAEAPRNVSKEVYQKPPPYATDPQYDTILSREDMKREIDRMIQHSKRPPKKEDVEKLIGDLVSKLKDMEIDYGGTGTPRSELEAAGNQILKIMEMHKQLVNLRKENDLRLQ